MNLNPEDLSKLSNIFSNRGKILNDIHKNWKQNTNSKILIVDGTNLFIRGWSATNSLDDSGNHIGGIVASLKSLGHTIKLLGPSRCIVVFDGVGGSFKRRQIYPEYKNGRRGKIRLNRTYEDMSDATTEEESCKKQYIRFTQYLQTFPVNILSIDHNEADDVIAYLATDYFKNSQKVYIMSSDKDFLQLCSNNISVYSPTKKIIYEIPQVLQEYNIHPNNFVLFRALDGDASDNINGIEGAGLKTIIKHFPWLNEEKIHTIDEIVSHSIDLRNKYKVCNNISEGKILLERNYSLMQLKDNTTLTTIAQLHCNEVLDTAKIPRLDRGAFFNLVREDRMDGNLQNHVGWIEEVFWYLDNVTRSE